MKPTPSAYAIINSIAQAYEQVKAALDSKVRSQGYHIITEKYEPDFYHCRYADWSNGKDAIRLIWDGINNFFYLQALDKPPVDYRDAWKDIIHIHYDPREHDLSYAKEIPGKLIDSLGW